MVIKFILFLQNLIKKILNKSQILNYSPAGGFLREIRILYLMLKQFLPRHKEIIVRSSIKVEFLLKGVLL